LSPQGRIQADLNVFCFADHLLLDTEPETREKIQQHIKRYIIADQVELEDVTVTTACVGLEGPGAAAILSALGAAAPTESYTHVAWGDSSIAAVSETGQPGVRIFVPSAEALISTLEANGAVAASADDVRLVRIENGRPRYGEDIADNRLPQETQQMHAVSFNKGCYIGQEIVERIRAQGQVNRKLMRVDLEGETIPERGAKTTVGGNEAEITSAVFSPEANRVIALAYVRVPKT
jgi:folate-binding protein YgfZ